MKEITYNREFISLLNNLSIINKKFSISKLEDKIRVDSKNESYTLAYTFNCDTSNFDFDGDEIAFYNFSEFYDLFNVYKDSSLKYDKNFGLLEVQDNGSKSKIKYYTANPEIVPKTFDSLKFNSFDYKFLLSSEEFTYIRKMVGLVDAKKVKFLLKNGEFKLVLFSDEKNPTFEKNFPIEASEGLDISTDTFSLVTPPDIFLFSPKNDYEIEIKKDGIFKFKYVHDTFDLNLFSAIEEDE